MLRIVFYSAFSDKRIIGAPPTPTPIILLVEKAPIC